MYTLVCIFSHFGQIVSIFKISMKINSFDDEFIFSLCYQLEYEKN